LGCGPLALTLAGLLPLRLSLALGLTLSLTLPLTLGGLALAARIVGA
jgi:hypothetical protein